MIWLEHNHTLREWCEEARSKDILAVDTEFNFTKTFYPELGLVQLAWDRTHTALVDPRAVTDPAPLRELLEAPDITKVFHEAASDLPILRRWTGARTRNVADTRIAAGFCGLTASLSLARLLTAVLGIDLAKTETRTDWLRRPLTPAQLEYAAEDVAFIPDLFRELRARLDTLGNLGWFTEELSACEQDAYYDEPAPRHAWKRVSGIHLLHPRALAVAAELAAWRESAARAHDLTRNRVLRDEALIRCAREMPRTPRDLAHTSGLSHAQLALFQDGLLDAIRRGIDLPEDQIPRRSPPDMDLRLLRQRTERLQKLIAKRAGERRIDPVLVGSRRDIEPFILLARKNEPFTHKFLTGWRRELLGDRIGILAETNFAG